MPEKDLNWQSPPDINAPAPEDKTKIIRLEISNDILSRDRPNFRKTPIFQVWTHLLKRPPPIANVSILKHEGIEPTYQDLNDATACFCGVNRPINDQENGNKVLTYVLNPEFTVKAEPRMTGSIVAQQLIPGYVLTVQIVLSNALQDEDKDISGRVTRIEVVECAANDASLPIGHEKRYERRLW